jgi:hypothetical protein
MRRWWATRHSPASRSNAERSAFRPGEGEGAESHRQDRLTTTAIVVDVSQELPDLNGVGQSRMMLDGGSLDEPADIHGDIAAAVPQSNWWGSIEPMCFAPIIGNT